MDCRFPPPPPEPSRTPGSFARSAAVAAGSALVGALVGAALIGAIDRLSLLRLAHKLSSGELLLLALRLLPGVFVVVLVHELGHLLGSRVAGWQPSMLFAGPLRLDFGDGDARIRFNAAAGTWGGLAMCTPPPGLPTRAGSALLVAGGPIASAALALLSLGLAMLSSGLANAAAVAVATLSAAIAVGTLLPLRAGGFVTDGGQLLALWRNDGASNERRVVAALVAQSQAGARPSRLDAELIAIAAAARHDRNVATVGAILQAQAAWDRRAADAARVAFETYAHRLSDGGYAAFPSAFRKALLLPVATWLGESGTDAGRAREWLEAARGAVADAYQIAHAQAAVAQVEQRHDEAIAAAQKALSALRQSSDRGAVLAARESLEAIVQCSGCHRHRNTVERHVMH